MQASEWFGLLFGVLLAGSGYFSIKRKRSSHTQYGRFEGQGAINVGHFWLVLGLIFIAGTLFDIPIFNSLIGFILESRRY
ncbi:LPXTG cell wall anchor domain-containing protein [Methylomonas rapida]|uniref:LPXTG cell wall anchor domain-containing protein n=1 Tax=Methylomonas rapida TaxID=2963939 RepID=A0ABY7GIV8_9GAMM|nr:LPXTG cell wall anchor domain-containing protein [Methylomonas rapida]WAR44506.1 LPXTG cell wall anchor domain-containing protein [Methylomonas rapida]